MNRLYVLYDDRCGLCRRARGWASRRPAFLPLVFLAAGSDEARRRFPSLASGGRPEELIAVGDDGAVYRDDAAWLMCLYALEETREWSLRLASPLLRPLARQAFAAVSEHRGAISRWLGLDDHEAALALRSVTVGACATGPSASGLHTIHDLVSGTRADGPGGPAGNGPRAGDGLRT